MTDDSHSTYRLDSGTHRTRDGTVHEAGDELELPDSVYQRLSHKFTPVDADDDAAGADDGDGGEPDDVDASIPDDWDALRALASAWDGDEITGHDSREDVEAFLESLTDTQLIDLKLDAGLAGDA